MKATMFDELTAADLMQADLITLPADAPVVEAIKTFEEYHISGVPVVDQLGNVIGVFSVHDVARMERDSTERDESGRGSFYVTNPLDEPFEDEDWYDAGDFSVEVIGPTAIKDWMTPKVLAVAPETPMAAVCAKMVAESVHRVLVMKDKRLVGLISSFDVVRFVAKASKKPIPKVKKAEKKPAKARK
jgi:CBS domain-containing protein